MRSPQTGVTVGYEPPHEGWGLDPGFLQQVPFQLSQLSSHGCSPCIDKKMESQGLT